MNKRHYLSKIRKVQKEEDKHRQAATNSSWNAGVVAASQTLVPLLGQRDMVKLQKTSLDNGPSAACPGSLAQKLKQEDLEFKAWTG